MKSLIILLSLVLFIKVAEAQTNENLLENNKVFAGAAATKKVYRVIYQLDNGDAKIIEKAIRNINNTLNDPRLAGKVKIELVAFSAGTDAYMKGGKYEEDLKALVQKGVIVSQCNNTLRERKIGREQIYDFIAVVPSGAGELVIRQAQGWAVIKP